MGEVAAAIAHEVNQPITSMRTYAGIARDALENNQPSAATDALNRIRSECDRASSIIRATRDLLRKEVAQPRRVRVEEILNEVLELMVDRPPGTTIVTRIGPGAETLVCDPVQLKQALYNLVDNAIDAVEEGGRAGEVEILVSAAGPGMVEFAVYDTGVGMSPDLADFGITPLVSTKPEGSGIGLSIARSVARRSGMKTVSLVDDDPGVLHAVAALFSSKGLKVECHDSGASLLAAPRAEGCVVSDLRMPGMNGLELLEALRAADDPRPVILLTAHGDVELAVRALKRGAFDFVEKPFEEDRLLATVRAALEASEHSAAKMVERAEIMSRYETLSERQKEVMWLVVTGCANKEVAARLGISIRTVETYRAWVFEKMDVRTLPELVRQAVALEEILHDHPVEGAAG